MRSDRETETTDDERRSEKRGLGDERARRGNAECNSFGGEGGEGEDAKEARVFCFFFLY